MIKEFERLSQNEIDLLLKAPVLVSLLAVSADDEISHAEKADAVKMAHMRTFTAVPVLIPYYKEVEKGFKKYFDEGVKKYSPFNDASREELKKEVSELNKVIAKLDKEYAIELHASLRSYAKHVRTANRSLLENFIFPLAIPGLTD